MSAPPRPSLRLRIVVEAPPAGVAFAVQRGRADLLAATSADEAAWTFDFAVDVAAADPPRLTGAFAQGPPAARFVYVNAGTLAGQAGSLWTRRAKVPLAGIDRALLQAALAAPERRLVARIPGRARDGGPVCASVAPVAGWTLEADAG